MGSSSGGSGKSPTMPTPSGPSAPYGQTSKFNPSYVNFLPDTIGEDGRMPMATGLNQSHLDAIRSRPDPMLAKAKVADDPGAGGMNRDTFAQMMKEYQAKKGLEDFRNAAFEGSGISTRNSVYNTGKNPWLGGRGGNR